MRQAENGIEGIIYTEEEMQIKIFRTDAKMTSLKTQGEREIKL